MKAEWMRNLTADGSIAEDCMGTDVRRTLAHFATLRDPVRYNVSKLTRSGWLIIGRMMTADETDVMAKANQI